MKIISLFSGAGGLDLGFEDAGFKTIWANENDKNIIPTYKKNFPKTELVEISISDINAKLIPDCDGVIGGPPCQSWSAAGSHRGINDERGKLFLKEYVKIIKEKKPKFFLAENVPGIEYKKHENSFTEILESLRSIGYNISYKVFNTYDYGVAQTRKRLIIVGYASGYEEFFVLDPYKGNQLNLKDVIYDLKDNVVSAIDRTTPNPECKVMNHEYNNTPRDKNSFHYMSRNRVRSWDEGSFTIPATGRHVPQHPQAPKMIPLKDKEGNKVINVMKFKPGALGKYRRLSVRECARIQGFPDKFEFIYNNVDHGYKMIGNAVPVRFAYLIAKQIKKDLTRLDNMKPTFRKKGFIKKIQ
tara:strand:+ start:612 stop:1679 length:1068 start_codon:yes stop_codon:yes gene_type:complete